MSLLPQDETGKAEHGYSYDFDMPEVAIYVDDGAGGVKLWDGTADFGGDVEVDTDALEALVLAGNVILADIKTAVEIMDDWDDGSDMANVVPHTSVIPAAGSTVTPLGGSATWTSAAIDCLGFSTVTIILTADVDSIEDGMQFRWSSDGTNWDDVYGFHLHSATSETRRFQFPVCARYFSINYINDSGAQGYFRVQTILHRSNTLTSIHEIDGTVGHDRSCTLVKASIFGETTAGGGGFVNVKVNPSGSLVVEASVEEIEAVEDELGNYHFYGWEVDGSIYYLGYQDKAGAWYAKKIDLDAGTCLYAAGASSPPAVADLSAQSYAAFASVF